MTNEKAREKKRLKQRRQRERRRQRRAAERLERNRQRVVVCAECSSRMVLRWTEKFGGRHFWGCSRYPDCRATHGADPDGRPLGRPGTPVEKLARIHAHDVFDGWWRGAGLKRAQAYAWLERETGIKHIGESGVEECERIVKAVEAERARASEGGA